MGICSESVRGRRGEGEGIENREEEKIERRREGGKMKWEVEEEVRMSGRRKGVLNLVYGKVRYLR